jgi:hypothetical protein
MVTNYQCILLEGCEDKYCTYILNKVEFGRSLRPLTSFQDPETLLLQMYVQR